MRNGIRWFNAAFFVVVFALGASPAWSGGDTNISLKAIIAEFGAEQTEKMIGKLDKNLVIEGTPGFAGDVDKILGDFADLKISPIFEAVYRAADNVPTVDDERTRFFRIQLEGLETVEEAQELIQRLKEVSIDAQLEYLYTPDVVPNDPLYPSQWAHQATHAPQGWNYETGSSKVSIAILGTGVKMSHPDLSPNIWHNGAEIPGNDTDDDHNGFVDDVDGWDHFDNDSDPNPIEDPFTSWEHESEVAGVAAAATNNATGVAGVCWNCKIMNLRVGPDPYTPKAIAGAIDYATDNGAAVINMSFGSDDPARFGPDTVVDFALRRAYDHGVTLVASAGNSSHSLKRYPGAFDLVIGVGATDQSDQRSGFSNYGSWVDVAAPGTGTRTTNPRDPSGYSSPNGTSFSTPYVAGLAGLLRSLNKELTPYDTRLRTEYYADKIQTDHFIGSGRVNLERTLHADENPRLFAIIKYPLQNAIVPLSDGTLKVKGTAIGDWYVLQEKPHSSTTWNDVAYGGYTVDDDLGGIEIASLEEGLHDIRLDVINDWPGSEDLDMVTISVEHHLKPGWPQSSGSNTFGATYADIDGDGKAEIFAAASGNGGNSWGVYGWHYDGSPVDGWPQSSTIFIDRPPAIGDIDGDGQPEIVAASVANGDVFAWHSNGELLPGWPKVADYGGVTPPSLKGVWGSPVLADVDSDGKLDVIVIAMGNGCAGCGTIVPTYVHVWRWNGTEPTGWPRSIVGTEVPGGGNAQNSVAVGQLDADPQPEIVVHEHDGLWVLNHDGTTAWTVSSVRGAHVSPAIGDVNNDGSLDIVIAEDGRVRAFSNTGTLLYSRTLPGGYPLNYPGYNAFALADVDNDGKLEAFLGTDGGNVVAIDYHGNMMTGWPIQVGGDVELCVVGDLDGDAQKEILVSSSDGFLWAWNPNGTVVTGYPKGMGGPALSTPAIGDIDADGKLDILFSNDESYTYFVSSDVDWSTAAAAWPMHQHDARHTGRHTP